MVKTDPKQTVISCTYILRFCIYCNSMGELYYEVELKFYAFVNIFFQRSSFSAVVRLKNTMFCSCHHLELETAMTCYKNQVALPTQPSCHHLEVLKLFDESGDLIGKLQYAYFWLMALYVIYILMLQTVRCFNSWSLISADKTDKFKVQIPQRFLVVLNGVCRVYRSTLKQGLSPAYYFISCRGFIGLINKSKAWLLINFNKNSLNIWEYK